MASTSVIERTERPATADRVEYANRHLEEQRALVALRRQEHEDAKDAVTDTQVRRTAEAEADDERLDELDEAIAAAQRSVTRSADRLVIAERRLAEAEQHAETNSTGTVPTHVGKEFSEGEAHLTECFCELHRSVLAFLSEIAVVELSLSRQVPSGSRNVRFGG